MKADCQCDKFLYYDSYEIVNDDKYLGDIQHHCRQIKSPYYIARKIGQSWELFNTWEECIKHIIE